MKAYLDYAATTPVDPEVLEKTLPCLTENFGNPDSLHAYGRTAAYALSEARDRVAHTLGVRPSEIYFTSGGTEADNWAVRMLGGGRVCVSAVEHRAVLAAAELCEGGMSVLPVLPSGIADVSALGGLPSDTGMVCVMAVNNETGCVQPIGEISEYCRARGILFFSDCVQAAGSCDLKETAKVCDAFSLSAHKIYGLKGTGALVVKKGVKLRPFVAGGEQERGLRGGTPNVAGIVAFSYALEKVQELREEFYRRASALKKAFTDRIAPLGDRVRIDGENTVPQILHVTPARGGTELLNRLDLCGIACAGGAACSAHSALPSHVMLAMGRGEEEAKRGIRFSFGRETTEAEVLFAADKLTECLLET